MNEQWDHQPSPEIVRAQLGKMAQECGFESLNDLKYTVLGMRAKASRCTILEVVRGDRERNNRALIKARSMGVKE